MSLNKDQQSDASLYVGNEIIHLAPNFWQTETFTPLIEATMPVSLKQKIQLMKGNDAPNVRSFDFAIDETEKKYLEKSVLGSIKQFLSKLDPAQGEEIQDQMLDSLLSIGFNHDQNAEFSPAQFVAFYCLVQLLMGGEVGYAGGLHEPALQSFEESSSSTHEGKAKKKRLTKVLRSALIGLGAVGVAVGGIAVHEHQYPGSIQQFIKDRFFEFAPTWFPNDQASQAFMLAFADRVSHKKIHAGEIPRYFKLFVELKTKVISDRPTMIQPFIDEWNEADDEQNATKEITDELPALRLHAAENTLRPEFIDPSTIQLLPGNKGYWPQRGPFPYNPDYLTFLKDNVIGQEISKSLDAYVQQILEENKIPPTPENRGDLEFIVYQLWIVETSYNIAPTNALAISMIDIDFPANFPVEVPAFPKAYPHMQDTMRLLVTGKHSDTQSPFSYLNMLLEHISFQDLSKKIQYVAQFFAFAYPDSVQANFIQIGFLKSEDAAPIIGAGMDRANFHINDIPLRDFLSMSIDVDPYTVIKTYYWLKQFPNAPTPYQFSETFEWLGLYNIFTEARSYTQLPTDQFLTFMKDESQELGCDPWQLAMLIDLRNNDFSFDKRVTNLQPIDQEHMVQELQTDLARIRVAQARLHITDFNVALTLLMRFRDYSSAYESALTDFDQFSEFFVDTHLDEYTLVTLVDFYQRWFFSSSKLHPSTNREEEKIPATAIPLSESELVKNLFVQQMQQAKYDGNLDIFLKVFISSWLSSTINTTVPEIVQVSPQHLQTLGDYYQSYKASFSDFGQTLSASDFSSDFIPFREVGKVPPIDQNFLLGIKALRQTLVMFHQGLIQRSDVHLVMREATNRVIAAQIFERDFGSDSYLQPVAYIGNNPVASSVEISVNQVDITDSSKDNNHVQPLSDRQNSLQPGEIYIDPFFIVNIIFTQHGDTSSLEKIDTDAEFWSRINDHHFLIIDRDQKTAKIRRIHQGKDGSQPDDLVVETRDDVYTVAKNSSLFLLVNNLTENGQPIQNDNVNASYQDSLNRPILLVGQKNTGESFISVVFIRGGVGLVSIWQQLLAHFQLKSADAVLMDNGGAWIFKDKNTIRQNFGGWEKDQYLHLFSAQASSHAQ